MCDGESDCEDGSDEGTHCGLEKNGTESCKLSQGWFSCEDGLRCIFADHICDDVPQCRDRSDEGSFCLSKKCSTSSCSHNCLETPEGPVCYCPAGFELDIDKRSCKDVDECESFGACSQLCENTPGSFKCSCMSGYTMQNKSCRAIKGDPILFFSTKNEVRGLKINSMEYFAVKKNLPYVIGIGFDSVTERVYWTDVEAGQEALVSIGLNGSTNILAPVAINGLDMPENLVIDEASRNIYFTDSGRKHVAVCSLDGRGCAVVISNLRKPRGIAIHKTKQKLLFTDWGSNPVVAMTNMDGSEKMSLVEEDLFWPNGLAVDEVLDRVYWSDAKKDKIESIKMDGTGRNIILESVAKHPFSMAVFEDTLYWSDWETREIVSCNKFNGKNSKILVKEANIRPMGITVAHPLLFQSSSESPCSKLPCSHVCLPNFQSKRGFSCACPSHLNLIGNKCEDSFQTTKFILSTSSDIYYLFPQSLGMQSYQAIASVPSPSLVSSIVSNPVDTMIYIVNQESKQIISVEGSNGNMKTVFSGDHYGSIAYDPTSDNLYWIDSLKMSVYAQSLRTGFKVSVFSSGKPISLLFVPEKNRLLVSQKGKISILELGSGSVMEVMNSKLVSPLSMVYSDEAVFIGDAGSKTIFKWLWGSNLLKLVKDDVGEIVSLVVQDRLLYWVEKSGTSLLWISLESEEVSWLSLSKIAVSSDRLHLSVSNFGSTETALNMACLSSECSHICFNRDVENYICSCPYGSSLAMDNSTCQDLHDTEDFACGNHQFIPRDWMCDGSADCYNGKDELNCTDSSQIVCNNATEATCANGACILKSWWCDGDTDCSDQSDESLIECPVKKCDSDSLPCANGKQCILPFWRCDGEKDCQDGSDEIECDFTCQANQFQCKTSKICVPNFWVCDGNPDCDDNSDEKGCHYSKLDCSRSEFECSNGNCIDMQLKCDGDNDCGDWSDEDESRCHRRKDDMKLELLPCLEGFTCGTVCLPQAGLCNGTYECEDESDEQNCPMCTEDSFMCHSDNVCIPNDRMCDGSSDCEDSSDELGCLKDSSMELCSSNEYQCNSGECIFLHMACDQHEDCHDGSDESKLLCSQACLGNGGCPQSCLPTPKGGVCKCHEGFASSNNSTYCDDINECDSLSSCAQICTNTKGSYKCSCAPGYIQEGRHCRADGETPKLLYALHSSINSIIMKPGETHKIDQELSNSVPIKSFAYNPVLEEFYLSNPSVGGISLYNIDSEEWSDLWLSKVEKPNVVAADWITGNIYFTQMASSDIYVCPNEKMAKCSRICTVPIDVVNQMALDPVAGRLFVGGFTNMLRLFPVGSIFPFSMDGSPVSDGEIIKFKHIGIPTGLALDTLKHIVYWSDYTSRFISACDYDGKACHNVVRSPFPHPTSLNLFEGKLYWLTGTMSSHYLHRYDIVENQVSVR